MEQQDIVQKLRCEGQVADHLRWAILAITDKTDDSDEARRLLDALFKYLGEPFGSKLVEAERKASNAQGRIRELEKEIQKRDRLLDEQKEVIEKTGLLKEVRDLQNTLGVLSRIANGKAW